MTPGIFSVRELSEKLRQLVGGAIGYVWVQGEITNLRYPGSGHVYFSLKDQDALLECVWFKNQQRAQEHFDPLTGEVFEDGPRPSLAQSLRNGQLITVAGRFGIYPPQSRYQLTVELAQDAGEGELHKALEALKAKLQAEGLFDVAKKRPLPQAPARVALITAPNGAAVHDFIRIAANRGLSAHIRIYPALVQGVEAPAQLVAALDLVNRQAWADVCVLLRGGGSLQDLWAFNDELLARAIAASRVPTLSAVGHEVDVSIADLAADVRAATPSHAAQLLWPERNTYAQRLDELDMALQAAVESTLVLRARKLAHMQKALGWLSPAGTLLRRQELLAHLQRNLERSLQERLYRQSTHVAGLHTRLAAVGQSRLEKNRRQHEGLEHHLELVNPLGPLKRGYALVSRANGAFVRSAMEVRQGEQLEVLVQDGRFKATVSGEAPQAEALHDN